MVDEPGNTTFLCSVHNSTFVDSEKIAAADAAFGILDFSEICNLLTDLLTDVLDDHFASSDPLQRIQAPIVYCRPGELDRLLSFLKLVET